MTSTACSYTRTLRLRPNRVAGRREFFGSSVFRTEKRCAAITPGKTLVLRTLLAVISIAAIVATLPATEIQAQKTQVKSKFGTAGVSIQESRTGGARSLVILYKGREYAKLAVPTQSATIEFCCNNGTCGPIEYGPGPCEIILVCPDGVSPCYPK